MSRAALAMDSYSQAHQAFRVAIETRAAHIGVVGLGYVGLPLAAALGDAGFTCIGVDLDSRKCGALAAGRSYLPDVPGESVRRLADAGRLVASGDYAALREVDAVIICVPTPVYRDKRPDLGDVRRAGQAIGEVLRAGQLVVLESTCYPGTTEEELQPLLERESSLRAGADFWLAFSPERIDPGNAKFGVTNTPKVVGGIDVPSTELAAALYSAIVPEVIRVSSPREAEMTKLIENTFRHVNIALANELAVISERLEVDFWEAMQAASSKPFGFMPFYPGPGVGGHCIPVDPHYLSWKARECEQPLRLIDTAEQINAAMPHLVVERVVDEVNRRGESMRGARVLLLGVSYKRGVADTRESPGLRILELLVGKGAKVTYHDPYVPQIQHHGTAMASVPLTEEVLRSQACVLLVTDHDYDVDLLLRASPLLIDTRNAVKRNAPNCVRMWAKNGASGSLQLPAGGLVMATYDTDRARPRVRTGGPTSGSAGAGELDAPRTRPEGVGPGADCASVAGGSPPDPMLSALERARQGEWPSARG
jgi:UDP-N-acetyl-D-glucosamine dehydrogenase